MSFRLREMARAALFVALLALTCWLAAHRHRPAEGALHSGAAPAWPWMPGGLLAPTARFSAVPFSVRTSNDPTVPKGVTLVKTPGREGIRLAVDGRPPVYAIAPEPAAVLYGTAATHVLTVGRTHYAYVRVLTLLATAYNGSYAMNGAWGGVAAWHGEPLRRGDVAVDPRIIPLGTRLYVSGYGPALAADTGSGIVGERIDLYFPEPAAAISRFGQRMVKVY